MLAIARRIADAHGRRVESTDAVNVDDDAGAADPVDEPAADR